MTDDSNDPIRARFGDGPAPSPESARLEDMFTRGSCRAYEADPLDETVLQTLAAAALASPTKSDLQQRDLLFIQDPELRAWFDALFPEMPWIREAPHFVLFLANNRRQRQIHEWRGRPFANDHLDAFFNAAVDAGVALEAFIAAADRLGLGTCPISAVRNHAAAISDAVGLPDHVFPICGLTLGRPVYPPRLSPRLPLSHTVHVDRFQEDDIRSIVDAYDTRRNETRPFSSQRGEMEFGTADPYTWSEDKARQYTKPERDGFGRFVRDKKFSLD